MYFCVVFILSFVLLFRIQMISANSLALGPNRDKSAHGDCWLLLGCTRDAEAVELSPEETSSVVAYHPAPFSVVLYYIIL